ncbi:MAG TPA: molybdenum cofactor biosynthesis protein MoaE [Thermoanaerobaculia bacterium]|nr:molybdenum cofactor biosynthesis protein MoaE [Thermoanaerobaculia bacterium]
MRIRLVAFASAADALGTAEMELDLAPGSRVADLKTRLESEHPGLAPLWPRLAVAIDGQLVRPEAELAEGVEVALLPPVSGGAPGAADAAERVRTALVEGAIEVDRVIESISGPGRGAVVVFLGTVRNQHSGRKVTQLTYSAYRPMARTALEAIAADLEAAHPGLRAAIVHRLGEVRVGEASVVIATASPHRAAAYEANRTAIERLKTEVPIWKREHYAGGEAVWREEEPLAAGS